MSKTKDHCQQKSQTQTVMLGNWKLRETGSLCDLELQVGPNKDKVPCHRVVMVVGSQYFQKLFDQKLLDNSEQKNIISVDEADGNINKEVVETVLYFIYLRSLPQNVESIIPGILSLAERWLLPDLQELCKERMTMATRKPVEAHPPAENPTETEATKVVDEDVEETEKIPDRIQKLQSSDGKIFSVDFNICKNMSYTIWSMILDRDIEDENPDDEIIPLHKVKGSILEKVIDWCNYHKNDPIRNKNIPIPLEERRKQKKTDDIGVWDWEFLKVDQGELFEIMMAAHYLEIDGLIDVTAKNVAGMMKGKSPEELRQLFNIENDFTPQEERQLRREFEAPRERPLFNMTSLESLLLKRLRFEKK